MFSVDEAVRLAAEALIAELAKLVSHLTEPLTGRKRLENERFAR